MIYVFTYLLIYSLTIIITNNYYTNSFRRHLKVSIVAEIYAESYRKQLQFVGDQC